MDATMPAAAESTAVAAEPAAPLAPAATREEWLVRALPELAALIRQAGGPAYKTPFVSVGFPKGGRKAIGQCWTIKDGERSHIFVHPCLDEPVRVLDVLLHELIHASVGLKHGHKGDFKETALAVGLEGKMTATVASPRLVELLRALVLRIGRFPHRPLDPAAIEKAPKQTTRMHKLECPKCGYTCRASAKWIAVGLPRCCCGAEMRCEDGDVGAEGEG